MVKLLYVGDKDATDNEVILSALRGLGRFYIDKTVFRGKEAINEIDSGEYDGVFMGSLRISGNQIARHGCENGLKVAEAAKKKGLPVIVMTDSTHPDVVMRIVELGVDKRISPFTKINDYITIAKEVFGDPK